MKSALSVALIVALAAPAVAGVDPSSAGLALPIELPEGADLVRVEVPPSVLAAVESGVDELRVADATGAVVPHMLLTRDGSADAARGELEPVIAQRSAGRAQLALLVDLRVHSAPGLALELALDGPAGMPLLVSDAADPKAGPWEELHFMATEVEEGHLAGRAIVPAGAGRRWVRIVVPTPRPADVSVARLAASVPRHRVYFRTDGRRRPFFLLGAIEDAPQAPAWPHEPVLSWDAGEPGTVEAPSWLRAATVSGGASPGPAPDDEVPFPWAEIVATILALALTIWAVLLRKER